MSFSVLQNFEILKRTRTTSTKNSGDEAQISCHDFIPLKLLYFLLYENDMATFGSDEILADIAVITG